MSVSAAQRHGRVLAPAEEYLEIGYNYCHVTYTTHAIGGLSENDFICAAKIDALPLV